MSFIHEDGSETSWTDHLVPEPEEFGWVIEERLDVEFDDDFIAHLYPEERRRVCGIQIAKENESARTSDLRLPQVLRRKLLRLRIRILGREYIQRLAEGFSQKHRLDVMIRKRNAPTVRICLSPMIRKLITFLQSILWVLVKPKNPSEYWNHGRSGPNKE